jgi:methionyl-tRNA formyltransferase
MQIAFFGTPDFALPSLVKLHQAGFDIRCVVTAKEKPKGRGLKIIPSPVKVKAQEFGIEVYEPEKPNTGEFYELLAPKNLDVCVLVAYGYILKPPLLGLPKKGFINLHPSLLPKYRGAAPINWAIIRGEKQTGVTTFLMNEKVDAGSIIQQKSLAISAEETAGELTPRLAELGAELLVETLKIIEQNDFPIIIQKDQEIILAPKIKDSDRMIDWTKSDLEIHNLIRGLSPIPGAYTFFRNKRVECLKCLRHSAAVFQAQPAPGTIILPNKDLVVATGNGTLNITQLKIEGGKIITGRDFINGQRIKPMEKFGRL